jgi:hypothetical protein
MVAPSACLSSEIRSACLVPERTFRAALPARTDPAFLHFVLLWAVRRPSLFDFLPSATVDLARGESSVSASWQSRCFNPRRPRRRAGRGIWGRRRISFPPPSTLLLPEKASAKIRHLSDARTGLPTPPSCMCAELGNWREPNGAGPAGAIGGLPSPRRSGRWGRRTPPRSRGRP